MFQCINSLQYDILHDYFNQISFHFIFTYDLDKVVLYFILHLHLIKYQNIFFIEKDEKSNIYNVKSNIL
jgi:hypothetical protein